VCKDYLSPLTYYSFLLFIWFALIYVIMVFLDLTATTFAPSIAGLTDPGIIEARVHQGGNVASSSVQYILIALLFGFSVYKLKLSFKVASLIFVPLVFIALWVGHLVPLNQDQIPAFLGSPKNTWSLVLLIYCFVASITPVWILLQPRDYLSSFLLMGCVGGGALGLVIGGFSGKVPILYESFRGYYNTDFHLGPLFPALFITIACGAISGFHSIVASGTTSKQLKNEGSAKPIAYGGMLVEGGLAVVALAAVMILAEPSGQHPVAVFASGIGTFFSMFGFPQGAATTFGLLAVSTFLLTTLDTCTRLARFVFQELFQLKGIVGRLLGTSASILIPALLVFKQIPGPGGTLMPVWKAIWPAFGATNQLLGALALLVVYAWLRHKGKKTLYVFLPMAFMCVTTLTALAMLAYNHLLEGGSIFVGVISLVLWVMAVMVIGNSTLTLRRVPATGIST
jgi:carbon starvation protein